MCKKIVLTVFLIVLLTAYMAGFAMGQEESFSYEDYASVLKAYVDDNGMVDYKGLKTNRDKLDNFVVALSLLSAQVFEKWDKKAQTAFWINAYNALTLKVIIDHYPIKASFVTSLVYPKNSIRQISGVWDTITFQVMGKPMTLDEIEHGQLRKHYNEPRIHMAIVCAAMGCPPLRNEPYTGDRLDSQLDDEAQRFLANPEKFHVDPEKKTIFLSPVFQWFGKDFIPSYNPSGKSGKYSAQQRAVLNFISKYLDSETKAFMSEENFEIQFLKYDWSLNEKQSS
jgi:hypothetical protein